MIAIIALSIVCLAIALTQILVIKRLVETIETIQIYNENNIVTFESIGKKMNAVNFELSVINGIISKPKKAKKNKEIKAQ